MQINNLFIIDGAAGTGKSDLIEFVSDQIAGHNATILKKFTTRTLRPEEERTNKKLDLEFVSSTEFNDFESKGNFYNYRYPRKGGKRYGFYKSALDILLTKYENVFVIVRSATTIQKLIKDYPDIDVIPIFVYTLETTIAARLKKEGYSKDEIEYRLSRSHEAMNDLYTHPNLYRHVIINNSDRTSYHRQLKDRIDLLLQRPSDRLTISARLFYQLPSVLQPYKEGLIKRLSMYDFHKNIFIMMKFRDNNIATYDVIKLVIESSGFNCVRADMPEWAITRDDVYNPFAVLYCCKYGIALFDEPEKNYIYNANVAVELALMHMQNKHCLMLKHSSLPTPPFDLASKIYQTYNRAEELVAIIKTWISKISVC